MPWHLVSYTGVHANNSKFPKVIPLIPGTSAHFGSARDSLRLPKKKIGRRKTPRSRLFRLESWKIG